MNLIIRIHSLLIKLGWMRTKAYKDNDLVHNVSLSFSNIVCNFSKQENKASEL